MHEIIGELILKTFAQDHSNSYTLEELTAIVWPIFGNPITEVEKIAVERAGQAAVLDVLIELENQGLIVLNQLTDQSSITTLGLQTIRVSIGAFGINRAEL